jgi:formylglycine-generating enzyme required for sulfatase activity
MFGKKTSGTGGRPPDKFSLKQAPADSPETLPEDRVELKPVLGVPPGIYLALLYAFVILLILFGLLVYPGLVKPGSLALVKTEPAGAAFRVDGVYMGTSPCGVFVPRGVHTIELVLPGFTPLIREEEFQGRIFGSLFFPRKHMVTGRLGSPDPAAALAREAAEFAAWSFAGEATGAYQIPPVLSEGVYRTGPEAKDPAVREEMKKILKNAARFAVTRTAARDLVRAELLLGNGGLSPSPLTLLRSAGETLNWLSETPGAAVFLEFLPEGEEAAAWRRKQREAERGPERLASRPGERVQAGDLGFTFLSGGILAPKGGYYRSRGIEPFGICEREVGPEDFESFLNANPRWRKENLENLLQEGLVSGDYLAGAVPAEAPRGGGITEVSWYAAGAYCRWLNGLLPPALKDYEVRLPGEDEWEYAAKSVQTWNASSVTGLLGENWEWCEDPYVPMNFLPDSGGVVESPERSLRGGSWAGGASPAEAGIRASLPPQTCSAFVSFRPVLALKGKSPAAASGPGESWPRE